MLTFLPQGLLGLVIASLIAAYMSTISTSLNLGASYVVNDMYRRFIKPDAEDKHYVLVARLCTVLIMVLAGGMALILSNALQAFQILLSVGAGTGLIFIMRWFWWRINAWSEITAMVVSFGLSLLFEFGGFEEYLAWEKLLLTVGITTFCWVAVAFMGPVTTPVILKRFYLTVFPVGSGWQKVRESLTSAELREVEQKKGSNSSFATQFICAIAGSFLIYTGLFALGAFLYGNYTLATILTLVSLVSLVVIIKYWRQVAC